MTFRGDLKEICLFDVFQNVANNQLTGTLAIRSERLQRWIHFESGKIRFASLGTGIGLPMRDFLARRGYVQAEALEAAVRDNRRGRPALRTVLEKTGLLDPDQFAAACRERLIELVYETFEIKDATFEFQEGEPSAEVFDRDQRNLELRLDPMPLLVEAARRDDEWKRIRKVVGSERDLFQATGEAPEDDNLLRVWQALDGVTDVDRLEFVLELGRFELCDAIARLVGEGRARPVGAAEIAAQAEAAMSAGDHARTRSLLEQALAVERNNRELRRLLAELYEALADDRQASETWAILGYQAGLAGEDREALQAYERAIALDPHDLGLREKAYELQERVGSSTVFAGAALDLAERYAATGLLDKGIALLERAMERPDLADHPELLERCAKLEGDAGRTEAGQARLLGVAQVAHRLGDRVRAERVLEVGCRLFPQAAPIAALLDEVRTNRRAIRRGRVRRLTRVAVLAGAAAASVFFVYDEVTLRRDVQVLLRDIPLAVSRGTTVEPLGAALASYTAHPFTPSRRLLRDLADSLAEAELQSVREAARRGDYEAAILRLDGLKAVAAEASGRAEVGWHHVDQQVAEVEQELRHRRGVHERLASWFRASATPQSQRDSAFGFGSADVAQILNLYPRLGELGQARVRWRFVELASPLTLPLFVDRYLLGHGNEGTPPRTVTLYDHVGGLALRARDRRWRAQPGVRNAFLIAYETVVGAWLEPLSAAQRDRARQLLPLFVKLPPSLPIDREGFLRLVHGEGVGR